MTSILTSLSEERKQAQMHGTMPDWFTTAGWQLFKAKYLWQAETVKEQYHRIAATAAKHMEPEESAEEWTEIFFDLLWEGYLAGSTPVLSNTGTTRGCPVSCSGGYVGDSVWDFYESQKEVAMLSKNAFGTSSYLGDIRPRGTNYAGGGIASGIMPVVNDFVQLSSDISQGGARRGSWAGYVDVEHEDFYELASKLEREPDDLNVGWVIGDAFIQKLNHGCTDSLQRYQRIMKIRCLTGKGYLFKVDTVNRSNPAMYKDKGLEVKASNLCTEITLFSDEDHTFTCVLSSMNLAKYDEWKETDAIFNSTVFLDCIAEEFIRLGKDIKGLGKAVRFTEKSRALGLGALGYHTYLQQNSIAFESFDAHLTNVEIFKRMEHESQRASRWLAEVKGEPEWCKGYGVRNTHTLAIAPNTSSALICGGVSQGIEPIVANVYNQLGAAGEIARINPELIKLLKKKGKYISKVLQSISENKGSVQHLDFLTDHEKQVFKTAYEIDQHVIVRQASARQKFVDQGQSLNLFFDADEDEEYISEVHRAGLTDTNIKALYYMRSLAGVQASKGEDCQACEG